LEDTVSAAREAAVSPDKAPAKALEMLTSKAPTV
jgi:hypothetical protein